VPASTSDFWWPSFGEELRLLFAGKAETRVTGKGEKVSGGEGIHTLSEGGERFGGGSEVR